MRCCFIGCSYLQERWLLTLTSKKQYADRHWMGKQRLDGAGYRDVISLVCIQSKLRLVNDLIIACWNDNLWNLHKGRYAT